MFTGEAVFSFGLALVRSLARSLALSWIGLAANFSAHNFTRISLSAPEGSGGLGSELFEGNCVKYPGASGLGSKIFGRIFAKYPGASRRAAWQRTFRKEFC